MKAEKQVVCEIWSSRRHYSVTLLKRFVRIVKRPWKERISKCTLQFICRERPMGDQFCCFSPAIRSWPPGILLGKRGESLGTRSACPQHNTHWFQWVTTPHLPFTSTPACPFSCAEEGSFCYWSAPISQWYNSCAPLTDSVHIKFGQSDRGNSLFSLWYVTLLLRMFFLHFRQRKAKSAPLTLCGSGLD